MSDNFDDVTSLGARLEELRIEHRDLDEAIARLTETPPKINWCCGASRNASFCSRTALRCSSAWSRQTNLPETEPRACPEPPRFRRRR